MDRLPEPSSQIKSRFKRRDLLKTGALAVAATVAHRSRANAENAAGDTGKRDGAINRQSLVQRHNVEFTSTGLLNVLTVGNGNFAFGADITGLQTFQDDYNHGIPLSTLSHWLWHTRKNPHLWTNAKYPLTDLKNCCGREVPYLLVGRTPQLRQEAGFLYGQTTRVNLGRIGLILVHPDGRPAVLADIQSPLQKLDIYTGLLESSFTFSGRRVRVWTCCHGTLDQLAVRIESPLLATGRLKVLIAFPYAADTWGGNGADWHRPHAYQTEFTRRGSHRANVHCVLDATQYHAAMWWRKGQLSQSGPHDFTLSPQKGDKTLEFTTAWSPKPVEDLPGDFAATQVAAREMWKAFWSSGAAIDLSASKDPRWKELERRIVLSQYLTRINCCGDLPPAETGLTCNSWFGKFHLEMHWWHAAHFALWGRHSLLERSLGFYQHILPAARQRARQQGYAGARWPKSCAAPAFQQAPEDIEVTLLWQQPHQMAYAELCYQARPTRQTLDLYKDRVFATADFLASFACRRPGSKYYQIGPPVYDAAEIYGNFEQQWNPTFEVAYFHWALGIAQKWRQRLGMPRQAMWEQVRSFLPPLTTADGLYVAGPQARGTFTQPGRAVSHPSILAPLGMLDGGLVDRETMLRTLEKVRQVWNWPSTWGWDYPLIAMTAARLGRGEQAIEALLMSVEKNTCLPNGHNYQTAGLPVYLPGNGGLLYAVALMAAGWPGAPRKHAPGFPSDGRWTVQHENLLPAL